MNTRTVEEIIFNNGIRCGLSKIKYYIKQWPLISAKELSWFIEAQLLITEEPKETPPKAERIGYKQQFLPFPEEGQ